MQLHPCLFSEEKNNWFRTTMGKVLKCNLKFKKLYYIESCVNVIYKFGHLHKYYLNLLKVLEISLYYRSNNAKIFHRISLKNVYGIVFNLPIVLASKWLFCISFITNHLQQLCLHPLPLILPSPFIDSWQYDDHVCYSVKKLPSLWPLVTTSHPCLLPICYHSSDLNDIILGRIFLIFSLCLSLLNNSVVLVYL